MGFGLVLVGCCSFGISLVCWDVADSCFGLVWGCGCVVGLFWVLGVVVWVAVVCCFRLLFCFTISLCLLGGCWWFWRCGCVSLWLGGGWLLLVVFSVMWFGAVCC